jgi:hypothetical protein
VAHPFLATEVGAPSLTQFLRGKGGKPRTFSPRLRLTVIDPTLAKYAKDGAPEVAGGQLAPTANALIEEPHKHFPSSGRVAGKLGL